MFPHMFFLFFLFVGLLLAIITFIYIYISKRHVFFVLVGQPVDITYPSYHLILADLLQILADRTSNFPKKQPRVCQVFCERVLCYIILHPM